MYAKNSRKYTSPLSEPSSYTGSNTRCHRAGQYSTCVQEKRHFVVRQHTNCASGGKRREKGGERRVVWRVPSFRVFFFHVRPFFLGVEYLIPDTGYIQRSFVFLGCFLFRLWFWFVLSGFLFVGESLSAILQICIRAIYNVLRRKPKP